MARGGRRAGRPGAAYSNRADLQNAPRTAPPVTPSAAGIAPPATVSPPMQPAGGAPLTPLDAPTMRPDEPLTTGLPSGPGAGPEALMGGTLNAPLDRLKAMYRRFPDPDLLELIIAAEE